jgi:hypothetical protein
MPESSPKQAGQRGCLFYGCLIGCIFMLVVVVGGLFGLRHARKMFNNFTDTAPAALPASSLSPQRAQAVRERVDAFRDNVRTGRAAQPLELTAEEINALIQTDPDLEPLKSKLHVVIEGNQLKARMSVPMDDLGLSLFRGRYLNGAADLDVVFSNGILRIIPTRVTVKDAALPQVYLETIRKQNLARGLNEGEGTAALQKLQTIRIENGRLIIIPKPPLAGAP